MVNTIRLLLWVLVSVLCLFYAHVFCVIRRKEKEARRRKERRRKSRERGSGGGIT